jgi:hypothetical protein
MGFPKSEQFLVFADVDVVDQDPGLFRLVSCDYLLRTAAQLIGHAISNFKLVKGINLILGHDLLWVECWLLLYRFLLGWIIMFVASLKMIRPCRGLNPDQNACALGLPVVSANQAYPLPF